MSTAEVKVKLAEKKHDADAMQIISGQADQNRTVAVEESNVETLEIGSSMIETVELSSSSFMDHSSAKKPKLHFDVEDVLNEGDLDSHSTLQPVVDDLMIDLGSVCSICYRWAVVFVYFKVMIWVRREAISFVMAQYTFLT